MDPVDQTQVIRLSGRCLYPLSHLTGSERFISLTHSLTHARMCIHAHAHTHARVQTHPVYPNVLAHGRRAISQLSCQLPPLGQAESLLTALSLSQGYMCNEWCSQQIKVYLLTGLHFLRSGSVPLSLLWSSWEVYSLVALNILTEKHNQLILPIEVLL